MHIVWLVSVVPLEMGRPGCVGGVASKVVSVLRHVGPKPVLPFLIIGCPCPRFGGGDELQCVLGISAIAFVNFLEESWAFSAPAGMTYHIAGDTLCVLVLCLSAQFPQTSVGEMHSFT